MNEIIMLLGLVLAIAVIQSFVTDTLNLRLPQPIAGLLPIGLAIGLAWGLDYSVFAAFGQELRLEWMHPVMTGVVLVAFGQFVHTLVSAIAHRAGEPIVETVSAPRTMKVA